VVDAVDLLVADQQTSAPPEDAIRLLDLRHEAARSFDTGPGRTPWPPTYDDPFPGVSGRLPEISATELTTEIPAGAVAHHGALVVRQLFDGDRVARAVDAIRTAQRASDAATSAGGADPAWYRPFPTGNQQDVVLRNMVARQGGTWLADSPAATAHFLG